MAGNPDDEYGYFKQPRYISRLNEEKKVRAAEIAISKKTKPKRNYNIFKTTHPSFNKNTSM